jgi:negative regulator of sigma E activity
MVVSRITAATTTVEICITHIKYKQMFNGILFIYFRTWVTVVVDVFVAAMIVTDVIVAIVIVNNRFASILEKNCHSIKCCLIALG